MPFKLADFYIRTREARKVIVVDLGFLGDTIHLVPALWEINRHYPQAELHVVTTPVGTEVLGLVSCVKRACAIELDRRKRALRQQWAVLRQLRREQFDVAFNFSGADRTVFMTALTGARWRVGYPGGRWHFWNPWLIPLWTPRQTPTVPVFEQRRAVLVACGLRLESPRWDFRLPESAERRAEALVPHGAIHFSINASHSLKEWPLENWITLARELLAKDVRLCLAATGSASAREQERLCAFATGVGRDRLTLPPPGLPIAELAAVLRRCRLHVGVDSGVLHLAVAAGIPTLSLFREYADAAAWMPTGPTHRVLSAPCVCVNQPAVTCADGVAACLTNITPTRVASIIRAQLSEPQKNLA